MVITQPHGLALYHSIALPYRYPLFYVCPQYTSIYIHQNSIVIQQKGAPI